MSSLFFGVWGVAGHHLLGPGGAWFKGSDAITMYRAVEPESRRHIDGTLAPRLRHGQILWSGAFPRESRTGYGYDSIEAPQGQFLRHFLTNGYSAIQWWDRQQGDGRGACNSTILMPGDHTSAELLEAGRRDFGRVFDNLAKAGIPLVEVFVTP